MVKWPARATQVLGALGSFVLPTAGPAPAQGCRGGQKGTSSRNVSSVRAWRRRSRTQAAEDSVLTDEEYSVLGAAGGGAGHAQPQGLSNLAAPSSLESPL